MSQREARFTLSSLAVEHGGTGTWQAFKTIITEAAMASVLDQGII